MPRVLLFNKPFGVLCQFRDKDSRPVLADFIDRPGVYPAGRLDHDSEGLLLLTGDGDLQARIADPRFKLAKTYWVQVDGAISDEAVARLAAGVELNDGPTLPAACRRLDPPPALWERVPPVRYRAAIPTSWIELVIREGRNRQVRRMTAAVGFPTLRLVRVAIGPWSLDGLAPGEWKEVEVKEGDLPPAPRDRPVRGDGVSPSAPRPARRSPSRPPSAGPRPPTPSSRRGRGS
jgi:23S rRNA pseudouridine2457 synthase